MNSTQKLRAGAWGLSALVTIIAVVVWGQSVRWQVFGVSNYNLFPLFGLLAFSVMWSHYIAVTMRLLVNDHQGSLRSYFKVTSFFVLLFILLHPGLLVWQLWRDGLGLPPESYLTNYVAPAMKWAAILGSISLFIFLAFELHRKYGGRPWWRYVQYSSDIAMVMIFIHALKLGRQLKVEWFDMVWWFYGISLIAAIIYREVKARNKEES